MRVQTKVVLQDDDGEKFFGEGPARLLRHVEQTGSVLQASKAMAMAYSKAVKILNNAEDALGFPLLVRTAGGASGGGSCLTEAGRIWLERYESFRDACRAADEALFRQHFPRLRSGLVIMASGLGKRFGGNKLLAEFDGKPLAAYIAEATEGLFAERAAATRSPETAALFEKYGIGTVLHDLPGRNDTVRLGLMKVTENRTLDGCLFCPADQPLLKRETLKRLLAFAENEPGRIWRPEADGQPGSPVWFPAVLFHELLALPENTGGSAVIRRYPGLVRTFRVEDPSELSDVDTQEDLKRLETVRRSG